MRSELAVGIVALTIAIFAACQSGSGAEPRGGAVNGSRARELVAGGALLLDVRTPEEFSSAHVPGAKNIPVDDLGQATSKLDRRQPIVTYCEVGTRSARAASYLRQRGFTVHDLGSMSDW
jgi:rhodanese-related sulfurtransferase